MSVLTGATSLTKQPADLFTSGVVFEALRGNFATRSPLEQSPEQESREHKWLRVAPQHDTLQLVKKLPPGGADP